MGTTPSRNDRVAEALFGKTRRAVLALFFARPHQSWYLRQIVRETGSGIGPVQREVARLLNAGLIVRTDVGSQTHYIANRSSPVHDELRSLLTKTSGIGDVLRQALRGTAAKGTAVAFVYGSVAAGNATASSDIDLMIIGDTSTIRLLPALRKVQERLGREINPTVYTPREFRQKARSRGNFVGRVLRAPRIMVIGTDHDLETLVGQPLDRPA